MTPAKRIRIPDMPGGPPHRAMCTPHRAMCIVDTDGDKIWVRVIDAFVSQMGYSGKDASTHSTLCELGDSNKTDGTLMLVLVPVRTESDPTPIDCPRQLCWRCAFGLVAAGAGALYEHVLVMRHYNN